MIRQSGHDFHFEIEDRVKANGWEIHSKESYIDDIERKPREIDFVAIQHRESFNPRGNQIALVVECKYLEHDVKLFLRKNKKNHDAYFVDGYPNNEIFVAEQKYHYFQPSEVVVQLEESGKKNKLYEAIIQSSKGLMYLRQSGEILYTKGLFYPIVVYHGPGKMINSMGIQTQEMLYYHEYRWTDHTAKITAKRSLYVDVIHESILERYLDNVFKKEMDELMGYVFFKERRS